MLDDIQTTEGAERAFRPFLDKMELHVPQFKYFEGVLNNDCHYLDEQKKLIHVIVKKRNLKEGRFGYGMLYPWNKRGKDHYIFPIFLKPSLFPGGQHDFPKLRKVVGTHEYVHCIASVLNFFDVESKEELVFRKRLFDKLALDTISAQAIKEMSKKKPEHLMYSTTAFKYPQNIVYEDEHYRLEGDTSAINYSKLFKRLLFSNADFERYIGAELPALKAKVKKDYEKTYQDVLIRYRDKIANEMQLYVDFVTQRIAEIFTSYLWE